MPDVVVVDVSNDGGRCARSDERRGSVWVRSKPSVGFGGTGADVGAGGVDAGFVVAGVFVV